MQLAIPAQVTEPDEEKYRLPPRGADWIGGTETAATGTDVAGAASVVSTTVDAATTKPGAARGRTSALGKARTALGNSPGARTALGNSPGACARTLLSKSHRARRREGRRQQDRREFHDCPLRRWMNGKATEPYDVLMANAGPIRLDFFL